MEAYQPFPDTRPALRNLKEAGYRLVIISNVDRDIIQHTLRQIEIPFDDVITSEDAGAYKPSDRVFTYAKERIGVPQNSSVTPRDSRISICPSAVAPPWLPIAGITNGSPEWSARKVSDCSCCLATPSQRLVFACTLVRMAGSFEWYCGLPEV
jgi:hypothetical protein